MLRLGVETGIYGIGQLHRKCFAEIPSYERFVALQSRLFLPLSVLLHMLLGRGEKTGLYVVDSSSLKVCHNKRIARNKVSRGWPRAENQPWAGFSASNCTSLSTIRASFWRFISRQAMSMTAARWSN